MQAVCFTSDIQEVHYTKKNLSLTRHSVLFPELLSNADKQMIEVGNLITSCRQLFAVKAKSKVSNLRYQNFEPHVDLVTIQATKSQTSFRLHSMQYRSFASRLDKDQLLHPIRDKRSHRCWSHSKLYNLSFCTFFYLQSR